MEKYKVRWDWWKGCIMYDSLVGLVHERQQCTLASNLVLPPASICSSTICWICIVPVGFEILVNGQSPVVIEDGIFVSDLLMVVRPILRLATPVAQKIFFKQIDYS